MLTKNFIEIQGNMSNAIVIKLFYKMVWWFDGQNIDVEQRRPRFNPPYQHIFCAIYIFVYIVHVCKCIIPKWVVDR
jgi:hypothetical protein